MSDLRAALRAKYASGRLGPLGREAARATDQAATDRAEPDGLDEPGAFDRLEQLGGELAGWTPERAFVVRGSAGRTVITAPLREVARANSGFTYLRGRFVEADTPNRNGAMWTTADLQLGAPTVAGGPLNWLHQEHKIIGTLLSGDLVTGTTGGPETAADQPVGNHIVSDAAMWRFLYPNETAAVEHAAAAGEAFYSMECIGREVACVDAPGHAGCGETFSYADYDAGRCCAHLRERSSVRRFVDPVFLGGAIIVPPVQPGWAAADVEVMRQAAAVTEQNGLAGELSRPEAEGMVAHILAWANRDLARDYSPGQRKKMAAKGQAQPNGDSGGSFPIRDGHDLRNAIAAFGRAKDKAATKAHIIKRARALGLTKLLPEGWQTSQD